MYVKWNQCLLRAYRSVLIIIITQEKLFWITVFNYSINNHHKRARGKNNQWFMMGLFHGLIWTAFNTFTHPKLSVCTCYSIQNSGMSGFKIALKGSEKLPALFQCIAEYSTNPRSTPITYDSLFSKYYATKQANKLNMSWELTGKTETRLRNLNHRYTTISSR